MAVVDAGMPGRLLLALDPRTSPPGRAAAPLVPGTPPLPPGLPHGLHGWDLARLCPPPDPPTPPTLLLRTNQSARVSIANALHHPGASAEGSETDPSPGQTRDSSVNRPQPVSLSRVMRSMSGGDVAPPLPAGCRQLALANGDDDDSLDVGAAHCSYAGLTAIPALPSTIRYL